MAKLSGCVECATAVACSVAWAFFGRPVEAAVGVVVSGISLYGLFHGALTKPGLESEKNLHGIRRKVRKEFVAARKDVAEDLQSVVDAAERSLETHLPRCIPDRQALAESNVTPEGFPVKATNLILEELAKRDPLFAPGTAPVAREFAEAVISAALEDALKDREYFKKLEWDTLRAMAKGIGLVLQGVESVKDDVGELRDALEMGLSEISERENVPAAVLRRAAFDFGLQNSDASSEDIAYFLSSSARKYWEIVATHEEMQAEDGEIARLSAQSTEALAAGDFEQADRYAAAAEELLTERTQTTVTKLAEQRISRATSAMLVPDYRTAAAHYERAAEILAGLMPEMAARMRREAACALHSEARRFPRPEILHRSIVLWNDQMDDADADEDSLRKAEALTRLGSIRRILGECTVGKSARKEFVEATSSLKSALDLYSNENMRDELARIRLLLGGVLICLGERSRGEVARKYLREAIAEFRSAIREMERLGMDEERRRAQDNLACALLGQSRRTADQDGDQLLSEAVAAFRNVLDGMTRDRTQDEWARSQNNLGIALMAQGERNAGDAGYTVLGDAVLALREALDCTAQDKSPVGWAKTNYNLGCALSKQADLAPDIDARREQLLAAEDALRDALDVLQEKYLPAPWAKAHCNLGYALARRAQWSGGGPDEDLLEDGIGAIRKSLKVLSKKHMPLEWAVAKNFLGVALSCKAGCASDAIAATLHQSAIDAFQDALEIRTADALPFDHAVTMRHLEAARAAS